MGTHTHRTMALAFTAGLFLGTSAVGGDLAPPPGPVAPTDRETISMPLDEPPVVIDRPGSYVLTSSILDCIPCDDTPTSGILIQASNVTLDLNGFSVVERRNSIHGIHVDNGFSNVTIRNGVVTGWESDGVRIDGTNCTVEDVRISACGGNGIQLGFNSAAKCCSIEGVGGNGVLTFPNSRVESCSVTGATGDGIQAQPTALASGVIVTGCTTRGNGGAGISLSDGCVADRCTAILNGGDGFFGINSVIRNSTSTLNGGDGIEVFESLVQGNAVKGNADVAINATSSTVIENHT